jgi:hypothetical protein
MTWTLGALVIQAVDAGHGGAGLEIMFQGVV